MSQESTPSAPARRTPSARASARRNRPRVRAQLSRKGGNTRYLRDVDRQDGGTETSVGPDDLPQLGKNLKDRKPIRR